MIYLPFFLLSNRDENGPLLFRAMKHIITYIGLYIVILCPRCFFPRAPNLQKNPTNFKALKHQTSKHCKSQPTKFLLLRDQLRNRWDVKIHQFVDGKLMGFPTKAQRSRCVCSRISTWTVWRFCQVWQVGEWNSPGYWV